MNMPLILASNSPRRRQLLAQIGYSFDIVPADVDEQVRAGESPEEYAVRVARDKAAVAAQRKGRGVIIGADTIVVLGSDILGKPESSEDAERMLTLLSGREHRVVTGLAVMDPAGGRVETRVVTTKVWFRALRAAEIEAYVATGEPMDKAGGYGIQGRGAVLVDRIEGCYFNVVGLPLAVLAEVLEGLSIRPPSSLTC